MTKYQELWIEHYGEIPREPNGKLYEIHHINGDHDDNRIENLMALTKSEHAKLHAAEKLADGTHIMLGGEIQRRRVANGTHNMLGGEIARELGRKRMADGTHHFLNSEHQKKASARAARKIISMDDQKVTSWNQRWRHEKKTGYTHIWVDL